jgi:glycerol kinase
LNYILGIDQSTAGTKALVFNSEGAIVSRRDMPHKQKISERGRVAHDPEEIHRNTLEVCAEAVRAAGIDAAAIAGIGISNQLETALVWERKSGRPVPRYMNRSVKRLPDLPSLSTSTFAL